MSTGHHPVHTGLQKHSVSEGYPLSIVGIGNRWAIQNLATGEWASYRFGDDILRREWDDIRDAGRMFDQIVKEQHHSVLWKTDAQPHGFEPGPTCEPDWPVPSDSVPVTTPAAGRWNWYGEPTPAVSFHDIVKLQAGFEALTKRIEDLERTLRAVRFRK